MAARHAAPYPGQENVQSSGQDGTSDLQGKRRGLETIMMTKARSAAQETTLF